MERIELPNRPATMPENSALFEFEHEGVLARVILGMKADMVDGHIVMSAQAFEMSADGQFMPAPNGYPSRTASTTHTINTSGLIAKTATLAPAWIKDVGHAGNEVNLENLPEGAIAADELPAAGQPGDRVYVDPFLYVWDEGIAISTAKEKVKELCAIVTASAPLSGRAFSLT
jgi:hypothetical protein